MKEPDATDRTYTVHSCEHGVWVMGKYAPSDDVSALLKNWSYRGLRLVSLDLMKRLGALVVVVGHTGDEANWLEELGAP